MTLYRCIWNIGRDREEDHVEAETPERAAEIFTGAISDILESFDPEWPFGDEADPVHIEVRLAHEGDSVGMFRVWPHTETAPLSILIPEKAKELREQGAEHLTALTFKASRVVSTLGSEKKP